MNLQDPGPRLTLADLEAFEREIGGQLPGDYKQFLLKANGGWTDPPVGFRWNGAINNVPYFDSLLPTSETGLRRALANIRELDIEGYLPITSNMNQDEICLDFKTDIGRVWFAHYSTLNDIAVAATMTPMTSSFTQFLSNLYEIPPLYCRIEELGRKGTPDDLDRYLTEGNSIDAISKNGLSILCEAIKFDNMPMFEACIERGANLSKSVYISTFNRRPDLIRRLADSGADVNEQDERGCRPLSYVAGTALPGEEGALNRQIKELLIKLGATK